MGADVHGPCWGIGHASGSAMLLVPDKIPIRFLTLDVMSNFYQKYPLHSKFNCKKHLAWDFWWDPPHLDVQLHSAQAPPFSLHQTTRCRNLKNHWIYTIKEQIKHRVTIPCTWSFVKSGAFHEKRSYVLLLGFIGVFSLRKSKIWAFAWSPSISLSVERPISSAQSIANWK